jgi:hypothetical protein
LSNKYYLNYIPTPVLDYLTEGRVVPLLGAGFSRNAEGLSSGEKLPLWNELGELFAKQLTNYHYDNDPITAISKYVKLHKKATLTKYLRKYLFVNKTKPGDAHKYLVQLPCDLVVTTNFDSLIEDAYLALNIPHQVVYNVKSLPMHVPGERKLIKIHGDLNYHDSIIVTDEDYNSILKNDRRFSPHLYHWLTTKVILFMGYSIKDPDFLQVLREVNEVLGESRLPFYILVVNPSPEELAYYSNHDITPILLPGDKESYDTTIALTLKEMADYCTSRPNEEVDDFVSKIRSIVIDEIAAQSSIRKKVLFKSLFEFIKDASLELSSIISSIGKAKKSYNERNSSFRYFPLEQQFFLYDTLEYMIEGLQGTLEKLPSFNKCKQILDEDLIIENQIQRPHNLFGQLQRMSHWSYISHILKKLIYSYTNTGNLNIHTFIELYSDLEYFFTHDDLQFIEISPIFNITFIGFDRLELSDRLSIRKIADREQLALRKTSEWIESGQFRFVDVKFVIEYKFTAKKGFNNIEDHGNYPTNVDSIFSSLVAALRLFQRGHVGIYSQHKLIQLDIPMFPYNIGLGDFALRISTGELYKLDDNQLLEFKRFWEKYSDALINKVLDYKRYDPDKYSNIKVAMDNFLRSYAKTDDDKFVDLMKSLMALLLLDTEAKTSTDQIIVKRCSHILEVDSKQIEEVQQELISLIKIFNQVVRGIYVERINIVNLHDYVSRCIIKYLDAIRSSPLSFSHEKFIDSIDYAS